MNMETLVESLAGMVRVRQAAMELGVSKEILRNWDKSGKLVPTRHPVTGYRYYRQRDLDAFLQWVSTKKKKASVR